MTSKTAETEADRFAKALLRKMQKCSGKHTDSDNEESDRK